MTLVLEEMNVIKAAVQMHGAIKSDDSTMKARVKHATDGDLPHLAPCSNGGIAVIYDKAGIKSVHYTNEDISKFEGKQKAFVAKCMLDDVLHGRYKATDDMQSKLIIPSMTRKDADSMTAW